MASIQLGCFHDLLISVYECSLVCGGRTLLCLVSPLSHRVTRSASSLVHYLCRFFPDCVLSASFPNLLLYLTLSSHKQHYLKKTFFYESLARVSLSSLSSPPFPFFSSIPLTPCRSRPLMCIQCLSLCWVLPFNQSHLLYKSLPQLLSEATEKIGNLSLLF